MALVWRDFISWTLTGTLRRQRWGSILLHILGTMAASNGYEEGNHETSGSYVWYGPMATGTAMRMTDAKKVNTPRAADIPKPKVSDTMASAFRPLRSFIWSMHATDRLLMARDHFAELVIIQIPKRVG